MEEKEYYVYKHTNKVNSKVYIGITCQEPPKRWLHGKGYQGNDYFNKSIIKYGWDNFCHDILYSKLTKEEAEQKEIELIEEYKSNQREFGYNIDNGGRVHRFTEETKKKLSESHKGKTSWNKGLHINIGEKNSFFGKHHTEETKRKISEANKGRIKTQEQKLMISESCKRTWRKKIEEGYAVSEETREKLSKALSGRVSTFKGHHHTEESKEKLRQSHIGKKMDKKIVEKIAQKNKVPILCYDKNMIFIKEYSGIIDASKDLNIFGSNISRCLKYENASAKGYKFRYKEKTNEK